MPQMVVGEKNHQKLLDRMYRKVFNKDDPFDRLIMELGQKGILDVCVVGIGGDQMKHPEPGYSPTSISLKGKHTS
jgi:hypothetical protein